MSKRLRIGYVPEHFSTPLAFAQSHYGLDAELIPVPQGTGALTARLKTDADDGIDVAVGLTEGFIADQARTHASGSKPGYSVVGTYVQSPLCWGISTGAKRDHLQSVEDLKGSIVGVSRYGSGSYIMSFLLADRHGWLQTDATTGKPSSDPFEVKPLQTFDKLRDAVNQSDGPSRADFFMWEHFTTKRYWDSGEIKRLGEIYTPWPSWFITARDSVTDGDLAHLRQSLNKGVRHYREHVEESVEYIASTMDYSAEDARAWMKTVTFADDVGVVDPRVVSDTVASLIKAGALDSDTTAGSVSVRQ